MTQFFGDLTRIEKPANLSNTVCSQTGVVFHNIELSRCANHQVRRIVPQTHGEDGAALETVDCLCREGSCLPTQCLTHAALDQLVLQHHKAALWPWYKNTSIT